MRIAILVYSITADTGTSIVARQQGASFAKTGMDVTFFTPQDNRNPPGTQIEALQRPLNLPIWTSWQLLLPFSLLPPPFHLPLIYKTIKPFSKFDVIVTYDYPFSWLGHYARRLYGLKHIWVVQGIPMLEACGRMWEKAFYRIQQSYGLYRCSADSADRVIVETDHSKKLLKQRFGIASTVIPNTIHLSQNPAVSGDEIRRRYCLGDEPLLLFIDNLQPHKGIEILLDSFHFVRKEIPEAKLLLIGKCRKSFWQKIRKYFDSSIIHIDHVPHDEIAAYYSASTVFATCALWEAGFSHTIVEAQAMGKPVVAFNIEAHREVVKNGESAILVDEVADAQKFALALLALLNNQERIGSMGQKAVGWATELTKKGEHGFQELVESILT